MNEISQDNRRVFELLFKLGKVYLERGQYTEAIEKFSKLIELGEENATTYLNLSKAFILNEQYDESATQVFHKTLEYDPDNKAIVIVLSQIYLNNKREDDKAYKLYRKALQYNPKNSKELILALIRIDFKNGNYDSAKSLFEDTLMLNPENNEELISYYAQIGWNVEAYDEIASTLKKILRKNRNPISLRWLVLNYLKARTNSIITKKEFKFEQEDIRHCDDYLKAINKIDRLNEIYIYLSLKKLVQESTTQNMFDDQSISEYELFLTDNSFSNIWDRGLNKKTSINALFNFSSDVWEKIEPLNNSPSKMPTSNYTGVQINADTDQLSAIMLIQLNNYNELIQDPNYKELFTKFDTLLYEVLNKSAGASLKRTNDGYILFWHDSIQAIAGAIDIFKASNQLHKEKQHGIKLKFQIIIHNCNSSDTKNLLNDLTILFEVQQINDDIFYNKNACSIESIDFSNKICITESVYNSIKSDKSVNTLFLYTINLPNVDNPMSLYEIIWEDALEKLRNGIVKKINRFHILSEICLNDVFNSYKAVDTFLDRVVIIKVLRPDFQTAKRYKLSKEFLENARKVGKLNHSHIAIIYDIGEDEGFSYIAREYVEGEQLKPLYVKTNTVDLQKAIKLCIQIGYCLNYAHEMGIIHGRFKPANIFISETNEIKITDFLVPGFSSSIKEQKNPDLLGISYASPEQINNKSIDHRSDIYSLGIILYELLTEKNPLFNKDKNKMFNNIKNIKLPSISSQNKNIPTAIDDIISKATAKSLAKRYENIKQFVSELQNLLKMKK